MSYSHLYKFIIIGDTGEKLISFVWLGLLAAAP
jgi:hypothetical protein